MALIGIQNLDNTCYLNVCIQTLLSCTSLIKSICSFRYTRIPDKYKPFLWELLKLIQYRLDDTNEYHIIRPITFVTVFKQLFSQFDGNQQHDAHECLTNILDILHNSMSTFSTKSKNSKPCAECIHTPNKHMLWISSHSSDKKRSIISKKLHGQFRSSITCQKCSVESNKFEEFTSLSIPLIGNTEKIPLSNCLQEFFTPEILQGENAWECERCHERGIAIKTLCIWKYPEILCLHFKRFQTHFKNSKIVSSKNNTPVGYDIQKIQIGELWYEPFVIINHMGNISTGHYTCYLLSKDKSKWILVDDDVINVPNKINIAYTYMIMLRLIQN